MDHPVAGRLRQPRPIGDFDATPTELRRGAPGFGENSREIGLEIGLSDSVISDLAQAGVLVDAPVDTPGVKRA
jgi:crotonobetainyl-CoA:carnitine CoA-transferase CaiB-like acyl-CoA transferase